QAVGDGATDDREQEHRRELERGEEAELEGRVRQLQDEPGLRHVLHPAAYLRRELREVEAAKLVVIQRAQAVGIAHARSPRRLRARSSSARAGRENQRTASPGSAP